MEKNAKEWKMYMRMPYAKSRRYISRRFMWSMYEFGVVIMNAQDKLIDIMEKMLGKYDTTERKDINCAEAYIKMFTNRDLVLKCKSQACNKCPLRRVKIC